VRVVFKHGNSVLEWEKLVCETPIKIKEDVLRSLQKHFPERYSGMNQGTRMHKRREGKAKTETYCRNVFVESTWIASLLHQ
jgi:hypothetical protein